ncbi:hypothetical protein BD289DRAFT_437868 [Coniella lustricola]|uniref:Uncharacterized protein n=1 Tax=Coniella lustricola TaxID=2025994 RepID=A0A2T3A3H9_9PEZI|nr:hypothetical protein BD289DRAFT_437868 [Coniella lustricola]
MRAITILGSAVMLALSQSAVMALPRYSDAAINDTTTRPMHNDGGHFSNSSNIKTANATGLILQHRSISPYPPRINWAWDRGCTYKGGTKAFAPHAGIIEVFTHKFDVPKEQCGAKFLDALRLNCGFESWHLPVVKEWHCERIGETGFYANFHILHMIQNRAPHMCVEQSFTAAAEANRYPPETMQLTCCPQEDLICRNEAPGHDPRLNYIESPTIPFDQ